MRIILKKVFTEIAYHLGGFIDFKANELGHDHNHGIVCFNAPILHTCVHIVMANNVAS